ncbi:hypothetical protein HNP84_006210 [Thermocatellispora tengchongensis]|uniref:Uncharacterized protein n=1 Tax=Thermocatellispora tengchongensis TaxID=1073253 RepID=A0A840PEV1_9ACTN|nr:hypothetical protein [Thermocatellispora tengchongensis]
MPARGRGGPPRAGVRPAQGQPSPGAPPRAGDAAAGSAGSLAPLSPPHPTPPWAGGPVWPGRRAHGAAPTPPRPARRLVGPAPDRARPVPGRASPGALGRARRWRPGGAAGPLPHRTPPWAGAGGPAWPVGPVGQGRGSVTVSAVEGRRPGRVAGGPAGPRARLPHRRAGAGTMSPAPLPRPALGGEPVDRRARWAWSGRAGGSVTVSAVGAGGRAGGAAWAGGSGRRAGEGAVAGGGGGRRGGGPGPRWWGWGCDLGS